MVKYELMLALAEKTAEADQKKLVKEIETNIEKSKGTIASSESWGKKVLAFPIAGSSEGHYWLVNFESEETAPKRISDQLRIEEPVLRFLITKTTEVKKVSKKKKAPAKTKKISETFIR